MACTLVLYAGYAVATFVMRRKMLNIEIIAWVKEKAEEHMLSRKSYFLQSIHDRVRTKIVFYVSAKYIIYL